MDEYYLISLKHTNQKDFALLFWGRNACGYHYNVEDSGVYTQSECLRHIDRTTIAVPKSLIDSIKEYYVIEKMRLGKIVRNTAANRRKIGVSLKNMTKLGNVWDERSFMTPEDFQSRHRPLLNILREIDALNAKEGK